MSLKSKIEAVIYASEEPVTLQQLVGLLGEEAGAELDRMAAEQATLPLEVSDNESEQAADGQAHGEQDGSADRAIEPGAEISDAELSPEGHTDTVEPAFEATAAAAAEALATVADQANGNGTVEAPENAATSAVKDTEAEKRQQRERDRSVREHIRRAIDSLMREYATGDRGIEIREVASGFRMATKPEYHDAVRGFVKSLKPALKLTLPALETLAVVAYKQPVTAAEISEIRGVDSAGVLGGLMARKLIATAGRKQVIGRPMLYKTTRDFLLRFGLKDVNELPSMEEFERMAGELVEQEDLPMDQAASLIEQANVRGDAEHIREVTGLEQSADTGESNDTDESADTLQAEAASLASDTTAADQATAETAAGGNDGRDNEPAAAAPLHTTETSDTAGEQASESAGGQAAVGGEEAERSSEA